MKAALLVITLIIAMMAFPVSASADMKGKPLTEEQLTLIEKNILANFNSEYVEVRANTIQLVIDLKKVYPEYDFDYAIIPLMSALKNDERAEIRILAALALYHFDSEKGKYAIKRRILYDSSKRVARHCLKLTQALHMQAIPFELTASLW